MKDIEMCLVQMQSMAELIVERLRRAGFSKKHISVLLPDKRGTTGSAHEHDVKAPEGAMAGLGAVSTVGGTLGWLAATRALTIPGLGPGPFIAAGPLLTALGGAASGGAALTGVAGALIGMGVPELEAKRYEGKVMGGDLLISVHAEPGDEMKRAEQIFKSAGAGDICSTTEASAPKAKKPVETSAVTR